MKLPLLLVSALLAALVTPLALAEETAPDVLVKKQEQLTREFRALLVRTYSRALAGYSDQVIEFRPLRAQPGDTEVTVRSQVRRSGAEPIAIEYDLEKTGPAWKVFDIRVAGISLAATPQRFRRGSAQPRHRGADQFAFRQEPRRNEVESLPFAPQQFSTPQ